MSRRLLLLQLHLPLLHFLQHLLRRLHARLIWVLLLLLLLLLLLVSFLRRLIGGRGVICVRCIVVLLIGIRCIGRRFLRRRRIDRLGDSHGGLWGRRRRRDRIRTCLSDQNHLCQKCVVLW